MSLEAGEKPGALTWILRIVSIAAIAGVLFGVGAAMKKGDTFTAAMLVFLVAGLGALFAWSWTGSIFGALAQAKRYVEGVEGDQRHEWYAFKGQRVRVFLDGDGHPWFALNEIAFILDLKVDRDTFRRYGPHEVGVPATASEKCLSESGLRRLLVHSSHRDAAALGLWMERDVLRMLRNRAEASRLRAKR